MGQRRHERLRRSQDFSAVFRKGRSWANALLVLRALRTGADHNRYGYAVGRRVGTAVVRNRVKRRLREAVASVPLRSGYDVVVVARPPAAAAGYAELREALVDLASRGGLLAPGVKEERR